MDQNELAEIDSGTVLDLYETRLTFDCPDTSSEQVAQEIQAVDIVEETSENAKCFTLYPDSKVGKGKTKTVYKVCAYDCGDRSMLIQDFFCIA